MTHLVTAQQLQMPLPLFLCLSVPDITGLARESATQLTLSLQVRNLSIYGRPAESLQVFMEHTLKSDTAS
ncbi:hypothetical protein WJX74_003119 [Apatococcus lobatus]|uniref:Uncharacterized protein n=1 Tax=Apatococcus lobatus TaxID=904363 RepID=A0AAW1RS88_9CHLO